ncbi:MAG: hypothetical protein IJ766_01315 [Clostridia bacterium]|nr:hypothetical protein [Clostridia bacterium]
MAKNKIVYFGQTLIDLTADTVTAEDLAKGVTAHDKSGAVITGVNTNDSDTTDATAAVAELLEGKTAYARGAKLTGTMPNIGAVTEYITKKDDVLPIPQGYHDGSGSASIAETERAKLIADNIRQGVEILGVTGAMSGTEGAKAESKTVTPSAQEQMILPDTDAGYNYLSQVVVAAVPYVETENAAGGMTVTIG